LLERLGIDYRHTPGEAQMESAYAAQVVQRLDILNQNMSLILKALQDIARAADYVARKAGEGPPPEKRRG
jgi:hypothetical protein